MSRHPSPERWPTLQRVDAERVLRRAIEIEECGGEWIDGPELRRIAIETGVDPRSVELALAEMPVFAPPVRPAAAARAVKRWDAAISLPAQRDTASAGDVLLVCSLASTFTGLAVALGKALLAYVGIAASPLSPLGSWLLVAGVLGMLAVIGLARRRG